MLAVPGSRRRTKSPGVSAPIAVAEDGAAADRAGGRIELVVEEMQRALVREAARRRAPSNRQAACARARGFARAIAVAQERLLVGVERGVDRIERHHRRQQRGLALAARHQVALGDDGAADAAVDR